MTPLKLAVLNLTRRRVSTLIAIISIALSVACSGILLRLYRVSEDRFASFGRGGDAIVGAKAGGIEILLGALNSEGAYPGFLPYRLFKSLEADQTVQFEDGARAQPSFIRSIIPFVYFARRDQIRVVGTNEKFFNRVKAEDSLTLEAGRLFNEKEEAAPNEVVLGAAAAGELARKDHLKLGDLFFVQPWGGAELAAGTPVEMKIVGLLKPSHTAWDREIFASVHTAQKTLALLDLSSVSIWGADVLHYFLVYLEPKGFASLDALVNRRTVGQTVLIEEQRQRLEDLTGTGKKLGWFVILLTLVLGALSVSSMLITRFEAMALQLAVLRAVGYKRRTIGYWLLWEGFLLGAVACLIGILLDVIGFPLMRELLGDVLPSAELVPSTIWTSAPVWLTAIAATTASVFIPVFRVYRQDIHYSLRD
jgi:putative ABC transport system permease protein